MCHRGTCIRYVHSAPFGGVRGAYAVAPRGLPPRVSPWAMVHRAYSPAGYVPFGPCGPFGLLVRVPVRPVGAPNHSPGRNPGRAGYVPFGPGGPFGLLVRVPVRPVGAPDHSPGRNPGRSGYVHSPRWGVEVLGPAARWFVGAGTQPNTQTPQQLNTSTTKHPTYKRLNISTGRSLNN